MRAHVGRRKNHYGRVDHWDVAQFKSCVHDTTFAAHAWIDACARCMNSVRSKSPICVGNGCTREIEAVDAERRGNVAATRPRTTYSEPPASSSAPVTEMPPTSPQQCRLSRPDQQTLCHDTSSMPSMTPTLQRPSPAVGDVGFCWDEAASSVILTIARRPLCSSSRVVAHLCRVRGPRRDRTFHREVRAHDGAPSLVQLIAIVASRSARYCGSFLVGLSILLIWR